MSAIIKQFTLHMNHCENDVTFWRTVYHIVESLGVPSSEFTVNEVLHTITMKTNEVSPEIGFALSPWARLFDDTEPNMGVQGINIFFWRIRNGKVEITCGHAEPYEADWEEAE